MDAASIAAFIGIKSMASINYAPARNAYETALEEYQCNPESQEASYCLNEIAFTRHGIIHKKAMRDILEKYEKVIGIEPANPNFVEIASQIDSIWDANNDRKMGLLLGFPANSVENYVRYNSCLDKINAYFLRGKEHCLSDNWTNEEVALWANQETTPQWSQAIQDALRKHQSQLSLTDEEITSFASAEKRDNVFGYQFVYIPYPQTEYAQEEQNELTRLQDCQEAIKSLLSYLDDKKQDLGISQAEKHGSISIPTMIWQGMSPNDIRNLLSIGPDKNNIARQQEPVSEKGKTEQEHDPVNKLVTFTKKLPSPKQPEIHRELDQNDITGKNGLGKPPLPPGKSSDDTRHRS